MKIRTSKRLAAVTLAVLAAAQLAGCSSSDKPSSPAPVGDTGGTGTGGTGTGGGGTGGDTGGSSGGTGGGDTGGDTGGTGGGNGGTGGTGGGAGGDTGGTGGGDTGGGSGGGSSTPVTVSGKAADGYLAGATVCLDVVANLKCDANEPTATTGTGGAFTLTIPDGVNAALHPIVVQVSATTIDEDTGAAVGKPYVLSAPAGESDFISPLTTVVHGMLQQNPALTLDEVITQVKLSIGAGTDVSLFEDYVAAKQDTANAAAEEYERLHRVAQVTAKVIAEAHEDIMAAATTQGIDVEDSNATLLALVTTQALNELPGAAQTVDTAGNSFDIDAVTVQSADFSDLSQQILGVEAIAGATKISIESLLDFGVYWMWSAPDEYEHGYLQRGSDPARLVESWSYYDGGAWVVGDEQEDSYFLTAEGWVLASDVGPNYAVTYQTDGTAILDLDNTDFSLKFSASAVDVSGKPIKDYLTYVTHRAVAETIAAAPVFSTGAKVYQINFIAQSDTYMLDNWYGDCTDEQADEEGNCNAMWGNSSGPAHSFAELIYPSGSPPVGNWLSVGEGIEVRIVAGNGTSGMIHITDKLDQDNPQIAFGRWEYRTVHGEQIMMLKFPDRFTERFYDPGQQILAVRDGYVRRGTFLAQGQPETVGEIQFNEAAFEDIENASSVY